MRTANLRVGKLGQQYLTPTDIEDFRKEKEIPDNAEMRYYGNNIWFQWEEEKPVWKMMKPSFKTSDDTWYHIYAAVGRSYSGVMFTAKGSSNASALVDMLNSGRLGSIKTISERATAPFTPSKGGLQPLTY